MTTSHRRPTRAQVLPQREATMLVEGISKKVIECKARQSFTLGFVTLQQNETFYLVRSERRENRYYIVRFNDGHCRYQCSCGCGFAEHQHLKMVRERVAATKPVDVVVEDRGATKPVEVIAESVAEAMVKAAAALPAKLQKVTLVAADASVAEESVAPVVQTEETAEVDGRAMVEQEISRLLSIYKTYKISDLRYRASKRGIDIKSRKRVDFINAILSSDRLMLEREYCLV